MLPLSRGWSKKPVARITPKTEADKVALIVERDLCTLTGSRLLAKYDKPDYRDAFFTVTGKQVADYAPAHNPFWHYLNKVWFDEPEGQALLYPPRHRDELAAGFLKLATGELDGYDGFHYQYPRRGIKTTTMEAFADWVGKFHKVADGMDVTLLYTHNSDQQAKSRLETIKNKNRHHRYIQTVFPDFAIPSGEYGTKEEWSWPCRQSAGSVAEASMTAMSAASKKAGRGYNYVMIDDWEDEESRNSPIIRSGLADNYDQLRKLKAVPFTREAIQGTPYHTHSMYKPMAESKRPNGTPRYYVIHVPAADENFTKTNFPTIPSLTLEGLAKERANEMSRRGNDDFFWLQYMLKPNLSRTQAMSFAWFQRMPMAEWQQLRRLPHFKAIFVDSAWKGSEDQQGGCYTAIGAVAIFQVGPDYRRVLLDLTMSNRMGSDEGAYEMCRMMRVWQTPYWACEQISDKPMVGMMKEVARHVVPPVYPFWLDLKGWSRKAKEARIATLAGSARTGNVAYLESIDPAALKLFADEADTYPEDLHRDGLDMLANSFADSIVSAWIPVGMAQAEWKDPNAEPVAEPATIGRYVRLPVYAH